MDLYIPGLVYRNVCSMLKKRGATLGSPELSESQILQQMNQREYILLNAVRGENDPRGAAVIIAVIIEPNSSISKTTKSLNKILNFVVKQKKAEPMEILLITRDQMQERLTKQDEFKGEHGGVSISNYTYSIFLVDITEHVSAPKHELADEKEVADFCTRYRTSKDHFSKIHASDPQAIWLGLVPGMIVRVVRASESAGEAPIYRICIKG